MNLCIIAALVAAIIVGQSCVARAANIFVAGMRWTGIPAIWIEGPIARGDEITFAAVTAAAAAAHQVPVVYLTSEGGDVEVAIAIGRIVRKEGLDTFVGRGGMGSWSACPLIWPSGRHAIVQRNSYLGFHAANLPEGTAIMAEYLAELGLTQRQINYLLRTPQPGIQLASEADALALGFRPQVVPSLLGAWRSCQAKYCLAVP